MTRRPGTGRPGMSLTEVLVALFILTLGVIGILTMFPLGAAQMALAVRDDRSALAAASADGYMRWYWQQYVCTQSDSTFQPPTSANQTGGLFDTPAQGIYKNIPQIASLPALTQNMANTNNVVVYNNPGGMSYPVIVDPMGILARSNGGFGDTPNYAAIPRCGLQGLQASPNFATGSNVTKSSMANLYAYRNCSLTDSLGYYDNGATNGDLEMRYNWMWVLQRPQFIDQLNDFNNLGTNNGINGIVNGPGGPYIVNNNYTANMNLYTANMTVVVFDRRSLLYPPSGVAGFEVVLPATFTTGLTSVALSLTSADQALDLKPGSWVMDASVLPNATPFPIRQAVFYRVVSVTQNGAQVDIELQTPVSPPTGYQPIGYTYQGTLVALKGVSGVFVRPPLTWY